MAGTTYEGDRGERRVARRSGLPAAVGLLLALAGVVALLTPPIAGLTTMYVLGAILSFTGVAEIVGGLRHPGTRGAWRTVLAGLVSMGAGVLLVSYPLRSIASATFMLGGAFCVLGVFRVVTSVTSRYLHWGWDFAYGVMATLLGSYVLSTWPVSSLWLVGSLIGIELVLRGGAWLGAAVAGRSLRRERAGHARA